MAPIGHKLYPKMDAPLFPLHSLRIQGTFPPGPYRSLYITGKLPEHTKGKVTEKCACVITESALQWKKSGLLLQRGTGFGKRAELRKAWSNFQDVERGILESIHRGQCHNDSPPAPFVFL
jgi:hypothetical protein